MCVHSCVGICYVCRGLWGSEEHTRFPEAFHNARWELNLVLLKEHNVFLTRSRWSGPDTDALIHLSSCFVLTVFLLPLLPYIEVVIVQL